MQLLEKGSPVWIFHYLVQTIYVTEAHLRGSLTWTYLWLGDSDGISSDLWRHQTLTMLQCGAQIACMKCLSDQRMQKLHPLFPMNQVGWHGYALQYYSIRSWCQLLFRVWIDQHISMIYILPNPNYVRIKEPFKDRRGFSANFPLPPPFLDTVMLFFFFFREMAARLQQLSVIA